MKVYGKCKSVDVETRVVEFVVNKECFDKIKINGSVNIAILETDIFFPMESDGE